MGAGEPPVLRSPFQHHQPVAQPEQSDD